MAKKLLLINPVPESDVNISQIPIFNVPPLGLGYIASLTPEDWDIKIIDENVERYNGETADLVGLTSMTCNSPRAYELSVGFKKRNIPVVMGGIHVSMMPNEALMFVDSIVIGEAENVWPTVIRNFEDQSLKRVYSPNRHSLERIIIPRRDLYSNRYKSKIGTMQTARGCPMSCEFCSVPSFSGNLHRQRAIEDVLNELETLDSDFLFFLDDSILGHGRAAEDRAISLFKGIAERGIKTKWMGQSSINFADNPEILKYAAQSGCSGIIIGFDSLNPASLKGMHKNRKLLEDKIRSCTDVTKRFKDAIRKIHDYGISVIGTFILGNDSDGKDIFDITADFILDSKVDVSQLTVLTPLPGTPLYNRINPEGRLIYTDYPKDWVRYNYAQVVFKPKLMSAEELREGYLKTYQRTSSVRHSFQKAINSFVNTKRIAATYSFYRWNRGYAKVALSKSS